MIEAGKGILHKLYGTGTIHAINPSQQTAFVRFVGREFWSANPKVIGGWFSWSDLEIL